MCSESSMPLPLEPSPPPEADDKRLWVGNLDSRVTEYHLIKLLQQCGKVQKFDFLFHKAGPLKGQPRGYCFVTYEGRDQAVKALNTLNGKLIMNKNLVVKWAHTVPCEENNVKKSSVLNLGYEDSQKNINVYSQINAIEAKLKAMEEQCDQDLEICLSAVPNTKVQVVPEPKKVVTQSCSYRTRDIAPYNKTHRKNYTSRCSTRR